ncbi:cold shock domain-containing protein [Pedobacter rhizosphaerae]|uniref:'Cold-shock' DNA-binding domain-containing protein n=1 Tax=Pedobacter rhizosphaerae TaxID=390241 RepID=A0A1H9P4K0_9SPHI|nr:cold shock domain-containing protein [Pedobacter rhizosphaerae]SER42749.1 'Cold-shock' DNA-binding domain-containing protein [Pedobacter rhizosphaerae]
MNGVITAYNKQRGFGLISQYLVPESIYFDISDCKAKGLYIGSSVQFEIAITKRGRVAKNIMGMSRLRSNAKTPVLV